MLRLLEAILCSVVLGCATLGSPAGERTANAPGPSAAHCSVRLEGERVCAGPWDLHACWQAEEFERIRYAVLSWCESPGRPAPDPVGESEGALAAAR